MTAQPQQWCPHGQAPQQSLDSSQHSRIPADNSNPRQQRWVETAKQACNWQCSECAMGWCENGVSAARCAELLLPTPFIHPVHPLLGSCSRASCRTLQVFEQGWPCQWVKFKFNHVPGYELASCLISQGRMSGFRLAGCPEEVGSCPGQKAISGRDGAIASSVTVWGLWPPIS